MHPQRVTVWCGFWYGSIIGPFFFENEQEGAVTINGERYCATRNEFLFPKIEENDMDDIWFQQDLLRTGFENRIISRNFDGN